MQRLKQAIYLISASIFLTACNSEYERLENYFRNNIVQHKELSDSLIAFCKRNHTEVIIRKSNYNETAISFQILFQSEGRFYPIYFDSAFKRHDTNPEKTLEFDLSIRTIERIGKMTYNSFSSDSTQTFFGSARHVKMQLGTQGDSQYGILMSVDTSMHKWCFRMLTENACLTKGLIP